MGAFGPSNDELTGASSGERSALLREAVRLLIEETLEAEVSEELGRGYYDRAEASGRGQRNGYRFGRFDSAEGAIEYGVPQVRGIDGWRSEVRASLGGKTEEWERLAVEMYARGLSMRDIEAAFTDARGRSVLKDLAIVYLFVDGVAERLHLGQPREAVLAAWALMRAAPSICSGCCPAPRKTRPVVATFCAT